MKGYCSRERGRGGQNKNVVSNWASELCTVYNLDSNTFTHKELAPNLCRTLFFFMGKNVENKRYAHAGFPPENDTYLLALSPFS